ncbi:hypothetical protein DUI87_15116 [Hirundo rustica rustica]|uniref:Solute carrier family 25 member 51 n=1 Tax=Hirundo rustica rustica TaxID=333673 RepID=A0A3M0K4A8_HIRRU|nr:hypothetical protein DUI87_15116 [Hirundo rustica rustica]
MGLGSAATAVPEASAGQDTSGKHYLCGLCAAFTNIVVTFPIQKVLFRQQLYGLRTWDAVRQLRRDGLRTLYRGILPPLMQKTTTLALMFGLYEDFSALRLSHARAPELLTRSAAAALAGTTEAVLTPFERVQTLLQDYKHTTSSQTLSRLSSSHMVNDFICGGLLGAVLGILFFPVNVVKTRMQAQIGGEFQSFSKVLAKIWLERDRKVVHLFRGAHLNYHRSVLSWGIINASYEFLLKLL